MLYLRSSRLAESEWGPGADGPAFRAVFAAIMADRAAALLLLGAPILYAGFYPSAYADEIVVDAPGSGGTES